MKAITEDRSVQAVSQVDPKRCGRCGVVMRKNEFCPACRKFFHLLSGKEIKINFKLMNNEKLADISD